ncbi:hypothetical protein PMI18_05451 [Pseudomonas sp. GM102]|nr:hypothetical protein PMI18_05451 [Pseudomonas sp. GM102]
MTGQRGFSEKPRKPIYDRFAAEREQAPSPQKPHSPRKFEMSPKRNPA